MKPIFDSFAEPRTDRRKFLLGLLFASAAGVAAFRKPDKHLDYLGREKLETLVPKTIGNWKFVASSGLVVPPDDQLLRAIYSQMLTRVYWDGVNPAVMLLIAQSGSQTGFLQIHRPETCYTAGGYRLSAMVPHTIQIGHQNLVANSLDATAGTGNTEHVIYWTRIGNQMPKSWREQKLAVAEQNLQGIVPDAILVRVSSVSDDGDAARAAIDNFIRAMIGSVPAINRSVFLV